LFAGIGLIGTQSAIFYQTLAIETPALITLLLSWHFVLIYFDTKGNRKILPYWGFIAFSLFAALMKENFILVLPASYLFFCLQYKEKYQTGFRETLFHTWETGLILFLLIVSGLWAVLAFAGSDFGYAGMGRFTSFFPYVKSAVYLYGISGCAFAILIAVYLFLNKRGDWKVWLFPTLFFLAITVPQIIIYSKSNIVDRYLIPAVIGCAYFSVFVFRELKKRDQSINEFLWKNISLLLGLFLLIFCSFVVFNKTFQQELIRFAVRMQGEVVQTMTSVSSLHYLQNTLVIIGITGLIASGVLLVMGFLRNHSFLRKLSQLYSSALLLILFLNGGLAFASCKRYAMRGFATENFLKTIINTTQPTDTLLIVGNPLVDMEGMGSGIGEYLQKHNRKNLRVCPVTRTPVEEEFIPFLLDFYRQKDLDTQTDKQSIKAIAVFPGSENLFENSMDWFDADLFNRYEFTGNYVVYVKQH
jgi:hypothetical protein